MRTIVKIVSQLFFIIMFVITTIWNFYKAFLLLDYPGCTDIYHTVSTVSYIQGSGFTDPSFNGRFDLSIKGKEFILYNRHAVFEKRDKCTYMVCKWSVLAHGLLQQFRRKFCLHACKRVSEPSQIVRRWASDKKHWYCHGRWQKKAVVMVTRSTLHSVTK